MVKIINTTTKGWRGRADEKAGSNDAISELESIGLKGAYLLYREFERERKAKDLLEKAKLGSKMYETLKKNRGELVCAKSYAEYDDDGRVRRKAVQPRNFFRLHESGVLQNWDISEIFLKEKEENIHLDGIQTYRKIRDFFDNNKQLPLFHSLVELLEQAEPCGVKSARIWLEAEQESYKTGFYLAGRKHIGLNAPDNRLEYFKGIEVFIKNLCNYDKNIKFVVQEFPSINTRASSPDEKEQLEYGIRYDKLSVELLYKIENFPYVFYKNGADHHSIKDAMNAYIAIKKKYGDVMRLQRRAAKDISGR